VGDLIAEAADIPADHGRAFPHRLRNRKAETLANGFLQYHGCTALQGIDEQLIRKDKIAFTHRGLHGFKHGRGFQVIVGRAANEDQHAIRCPARDLAGLDFFSSDRTASLDALV